MGRAVSPRVTEGTGASRFPPCRCSTCSDSAWVIHHKPVQKPTRTLGKPQKHTMEDNDT